jgi:hypothetical protein
MIPGETIRSGAPRTCPECGIMPPFGVCHSSAGYYIGTYCECGPYSRETEYFKSEIDAKMALIKFRLTGILDKERY